MKSLSPLGLALACGFGGAAVAWLFTHSSIWAGTVLLVVAAYVWLVRKEQD